MWYRGWVCGQAGASNGFRLNPGRGAIYWKLLMKSTFYDSADISLKQKQC